MQNLQTEIDGKTAPALVPQLQAETAELEWWKTSDGVKHAVRIWRSSQQAVVLYLHGIESHGRWFEETALELNKSGIDVYAPDRRGAGLSRVKRGHADRWQRLVDDADEILAQLRRRHRQIPLFIVANCWGAKVALSVAARQHNFTLKGLVVISPAIDVMVDVSPFTKAQIGIDLLRGGQSYFDIPLTPEHFTDVPRYLEYVRSDPFRLTRATSRFFIESLKLTSECKQSAQRLSMPILVLQSGRDTIVSVEKIKSWVDGLDVSDKTLTMFESAAHSLDFDPQKSKYQTALAKWITERAARSGNVQVS